jgi:hypothetical protein
MFLKESPIIFSFEPDLVKYSCGLLPIWLQQKIDEKKHRCADCCSLTEVIFCKMKFPQNWLLSCKKASCQNFFKFKKIYIIQENYFFKLKIISYKN